MLATVDLGRDRSASHFLLSLAEVRSS